MRLQATNHKPRRSTLFILLSGLLLPLIPGSGITAVSPDFELLRGGGMLDSITIRVFSKVTPGVYDTVEEPKNLKFKFLIKGQCSDPNYYVKSASINVGSYKYDLPIFDKLRTLSRSFDLPVPYVEPDLTSFYEPLNYTPSNTHSPTEACNVAVDREVSHGKTRKEALGGISYIAPAYKAEFVVWCKSLSEGEIASEIKPDRKSYGAMNYAVHFYCVPTQPIRTKPLPSRTIPPPPPIASVIVNADPKLTE